MVGTDVVAVERELRAGRLGCPGCRGVLRPWGHARACSVRQRVGTLRLRPRRSRCAGCRGTHVLLAGGAVPAGGRGGRDRIPGIADQHPGAEGAAKAWVASVSRQLPAAFPDRALPVPHQHPRHRAELGQQPPPAVEQVLRASGGHSSRATASGRSRSPSPAPAAGSRCGPARTRPAARCRGTRGRAVRSPLGRSWSARPEPAAGTPGGARAPAP